MKMRFRPLNRAAISIVLLFTVLVVRGTAVQAQSVEAVIEKMKAKQEQQFADVDNYIIETDKYTSYFKKVEQDGTPTYQSRTIWNDQEGLLGTMDFADSPVYQSNPEELEKLRQHATYGGTEMVDGVNCYVLLVDDPEALAGDDASPDEEMGASEEMEESTTEQLRFYVDASKYVPIRMDYSVKITRDGQTQEITPTVRFMDYRTVDGLTIPYRMEMKMENLNASMSPEEREQARKSLEQMEEKLKQMNEQQRKMVEGMMKGQMENLRKIIEEGTIEYTMQVQDVKVNTDIPDDVFNNSSSN